MRANFLQDRKALLLAVQTPDISDADLADSLQPGGYAILSGILNEQADEVIGVYARCGINLVERESIVDWTTLTLQKNT